MHEDIKLHQEVAIGAKHKEVWDSLVKPFFDAKQTQLFTAFQTVDSHDLNNLQLIKLQSTALRAMEIHFMHFIDTGRLAEFQLTSKEGEKNG